MDTPMIPILLERIEKLERSNCRLKLGGLVLLVGLAAIGVMGQTPPWPSARCVSGSNPSPAPQ